MENKFNPRAIRMIFGLGNPGVSYEKTYHNLGARFAEEFLKAKNGPPFKRYARGGFKYAAVNGFRVVVPFVFMNESGKIYRHALEFFNVLPEETLVVHDENDLRLGNYKFDFRRGDAGHKGVSSIIRTTGTKNFWRLRLGIQPVFPERKKAEEFVLSPMSSKDKKTAEALFREIISNYFA